MSSKGDQRVRLILEKQQRKADVLEAIYKDHANALAEANNQAKQQFALSQLFVTVLFTAFGLAFEKKIEAAFAILPLFGGMCVMTLFWKDVIWYLAQARVIDAENMINRMLGKTALAWGSIHGEAYTDFGTDEQVVGKYHIGRMRGMMNVCYFYVVFMYLSVLTASAVIWSMGTERLMLFESASYLPGPGSPGRIATTLIHMVVFVLVLFLWGSRRKWLKLLGNSLKGGV